MLRSQLVLLMVAAFGAVNADVYMHSPRGANNRLDEDNRDRTNGDRMFNSQNNARGGSNVGSIQGEQFYQGSVLPLEWTNQHTCGVPTEAGQPNNDCNVIWQYMCDLRLRDGTTTATIPVNNADCNDDNCDTDTEYGRHESQDYYNMCSMTQRNLNLYTANQDMLGDAGDGADSVGGIEGAGAIATRQNPQGNPRRGYECDEERDYYPYWRDSPWVDIVVLTNTPERCETYVQESQNVKGRGSCIIGNADTIAAKLTTVGWIPINAEQCVEKGYTWDALAYPAHGVAAPACVESMPQRDNHNGNTDGQSQGLVAGYNSVYNWTIPTSVDGKHCAVRVRYNVSSSENVDQTKLLPAGEIKNAYGFAALNSIAPSITVLANQNPPGDAGNTGTKTKVDVWSQFGLTAGDSNQNTRDYGMRNNPQVQPFVDKDLAGAAAMLDGEAIAAFGQDAPRFQLAINTNQFFRTFSDRTHTIALGVPRPTAIPEEAVIYNINARGKRGNIVQTYPGTEYDMVPNRLAIRVDDYLHFQWTGSDNNPAANAGEGNAGEDRHNVVMIREWKYKEEGMTENSPIEGAYHGQWGRNYPTENIAANPFLGWNTDLLDNLAVDGITNSRVNTGANRVTAAGIGEWRYMGTRNNNFTNRSQKAFIAVRSVAEMGTSMGYSGGHVFAGPDYLKVHAGTLSKQHKVLFTAGPSHNEWESNWVNVEVYTEGNTAHAFHVRDGKSNTIDLHMKYTPSAFTKPTLYKTIDGVTAAHPADFNHERGVMFAKVNNGGMHVIKYHVNAPLIVGLGASTLFMLSAIVAGTVASCRKASKSA